MSVGLGLPLLFEPASGGRPFPRLLLHRPHPDPNQPDEPLPLLTLMDHHQLQDND